MQFFDNFTQPQSVAVNSVSKDISVSGSSSADLRGLSAIFNASANIGNGNLSVFANKIGTGLLRITYSSPIGGTVLKQNSIISVPINNSISTNIIVDSISLDIRGNQNIVLTGILTNNVFNFTIPNQIIARLMSFTFNVRNVFGGQQRQVFFPIFTVISGGNGSDTNSCGY